MRFGRRIQNLRGERGQATMELLVCLPFLLWLISYMFNAFYAIHTAHIAQRAAAGSVYMRVNHRAKFVLDAVQGDRVVAPKNYGGVTYGTGNFMAVQHLDVNGQLPNRTILFGGQGGSSGSISNVIGICREPACNSSTQ